MSLKLTEELFIVTVKNDAEFEKDLTYHYKFDMIYLTNFELSFQKFQKLTL